jgi:polyisoprenoid-binding protein YceI
VPGRVAYAIESGQIVVTARSSIHDTRTIWSRLSGTIAVDPAAPQAGASAEVAVDMRAFDAGDRLKNWKLRSDLDPDRHPTATFRLDRLEVNGAEPLAAAASGVLAWRGREVEIRASGDGTISADALRARARFDLDVRSLGVEPPKIFFLKVDHVVRVEVTLSALPTR